MGIADAVAGAVAAFGLVAVVLLADRMAVRGGTVTARAVPPPVRHLLSSGRGIRQLAALMVAGLFSAGAPAVAVSQQPSGAMLGLLITLSLAEFGLLAVLLSPNFIEGHTEDAPAPAAPPGPPPRRPTHVQPVRAPASMARPCSPEASPEAKGGLGLGQAAAAVVALVLIGAVGAARAATGSGKHVPAGAKGLAQRLTEAHIDCMTPQRFRFDVTGEALLFEAYQCPRSGIRLVTFLGSESRRAFLEQAPQPAGTAVLTGDDLLLCPGHDLAVRVAALFNGGIR